MTKTSLTCRKMAAILGQVRSFLAALPFLRAFTDHLVQFVRKQQTQGWDCSLRVPSELKEQILNIKNVLLSWEGRQFGGLAPVRMIHSDSSTQGWGAIELLSGQKLHEFWRTDQGLHINVKELKAAMAAVQSLARPGEVVHLTVDNQVTYHYLRKTGGRLPHFNQMMRPFLTWCAGNRIYLEVNWVKSAEMLADELSRWDHDSGDYKLHPPLFLQARKIFQSWGFTPAVDMFASPGNAQLQKFVARWPHHQAIGCNALELNLSDPQFTMLYANPPWTIILPWLERLRQQPQIQCLTVVPYWVGTSWWPLLTHLQVRGSPVVLASPRWGMFQSCLGLNMPPTKWPLLFVLLSGRHYNERKFRLKISHHI